MLLNWLTPWKRKPVTTGAKSWTYTDDEGWVDINWDPGFWQQNLKGPQTMYLNETVEACVSTLSQTVAMCPIHHYVESDDGSETRRRNSYIERVLKYPNPYQTRTQFFNEAVRSLYFHGNSYAVASRDNRNAVNRLDLVDPRSSRGVFSMEDGQVYYWIAPYAEGPPMGFNENTDMIVPARDMLHIRINTGRNPLKGESPIVTAARSVQASNALTAHQASFFSNMRRASGVLETDEKLSPDLIRQLRQAVDEQTKKQSSGGMPIFAHGLKFKQTSLTSQDAQLIEAYGMTVEGISRAFRVPLALINDMRDSTLNNAEAVMNWFLASGLGFLLEHIELELGRLFGLQANERVNFETRTLLRSDWKSRIETLGEGVLKGIYSPNEARAMERLGPVSEGDEPRVQQQVVPLSAWSATETQPLPAPAEPVEAAIPRHMGIYKEGQAYREQNIVTKGRAMFLALRDTDTAPPGDDWEMIFTTKAGGKA